MKFFGILCYLFIVFFSSLFATNYEIQNIYFNLKKIELDENKNSIVKSIKFQRDAATFILEKGKIIFFNPVEIWGDEHFTGALFIGDGIFSFKPATDFEEKQLARFYKKELTSDTTFVKPFKLLYLRFADSTYTELNKYLNFYHSPPSKEEKEEKDYCERYIFEKHNDDVIYNVLLSKSMNSTNGFFYAHISDERTEPIFFCYNPNQREEVEFQNRVSELNYLRQTINQFHKKEDYRNNIDFNTERKCVLCVNHYKINISMVKKGNFTSQVNISYSVLKDSVKLLRFKLDEDLNVDSVLNGGGTCIQFIKEDKSPNLILFLGNLLKKRDSTEVTIFYHGKLLKDNWNSYYCKLSTYWYPRISGGYRATYDLTFKIPSNYECISVGTKIKDEKKGKYRICRWVYDKPLSDAHFKIGNFKTRTISIKEYPDISIIISEKCIKKLNKYYKTQSEIKILHIIGHDIVNIIKLFSYLFGKFPYDKLLITDSPYKGAISFPAFILIPLKYFIILGFEGKSEIIRAHEVAHQWWGNSIECKTYHDVWLSEGFAQYFGLWYLQWVLQDNQRFFEVLNEWKEEIITNRKYLIRNGTEGGPIYLGQRITTSETEGDYLLIVYKKSAFVLHMIRNMLLDLETMDEEKFINLLHDLFKTYEGKAISTEDFKAIVEKHIGEDMDWFFEQWVYGNKIPTYRVSYNISEINDDTFQINLHVTQEGVPEDFKMYVPLTLKFNDGGSLRTRLLINKPFVEYAIPISKKPKEVIFNDFNSVLAKVRYIK